jgi:hypothetical protein
MERRAASRCRLMSTRPIKALSAPQKAHRKVGLIALLRKDRSRVPVERQAPLER